MSDDGSFRLTDRLFRGRRLFRLLFGEAELHLVVDEELARYDEEEEHARQDVGEIAADAECTRDLCAAHVDEGVKQCGEAHRHGAELAEPGDQNRREASAVHGVGGDGVAGAADDQKPRKPAHDAAEYHGADDDLLDIDADILRGVFALAHDGELVTVLAEAEVDEHQDDEHRDDDDVEDVVIPADLGEVPVGQGAEDGGAAGHPLVDADRNELHCDIVHHEGEQSLVGAPLRLEDCGDDRPRHAEQHAHSEHDEYEQGIVDSAAQILYADHAAQATHEHLPFRADVPELHLESGRERERYAKQDCGVLEKLQHRLSAAEHIDEQLLEESGKARSVHQRDAEDCADEECDHHGGGAYEPRLPLGEVVALDDADERLFVSVMQCHLQPPPSFLPNRSCRGRFPLLWYSCRPGCPSPCRRR